MTPYLHLHLHHILLLTLLILILTTLLTPITFQPTLHSIIFLIFPLHYLPLTITLPLLLLPIISPLHHHLYCLHPPTFLSENPQDTLNHHLTYKTFTATLYPTLILTQSLLPLHHLLTVSTLFHHFCLINNFLMHTHTTS
jgi:hypothetical protein